VLLVARRVAARNEGEVHVCDEAGKLETIYAYRGGAELVRNLKPWGLPVVPAVPEC
jgi:hypothetical protein